MKEYAIWYNHCVVGYCKMNKMTADKLNGLCETTLFFGFDKKTNPERYKKGGE